MSQRNRSFYFTLLICLSLFFSSSLTLSAQGSPQEMLDKLWKALLEYYPMMEYAGAFDDRWYEECTTQLEGIDDLQTALPVMERLVDRLHDYHTRLVWEGKPSYSSPALSLGWVEDQVVVTQTGPDAAVSAGDIVLRIDGEDASSLFLDLVKTVKGATVYEKQAAAARQLLSGEKDSTVTLELLGIDGEGYEVQLKRTGWNPDRGEEAISSRKLDDKTGYIKVSRWGGFGEGEVDAVLELMKDLPYLVVDVRDNGGGSDGLAEVFVSRFISQPVVCSISFFRKAGTDQYEKKTAVVHPRGEWRYEGKTAVLINAGCKSATEHFVSGMEEAGAALVGVPTTGACGWIRKVDLGEGVVLFCSMSLPLHGKTLSPLQGMQPHHLVLPTVKDIREQRDTALEKAVDVLLNE